MFGVVSDGASMTKKFPRLLGTEHQICHAHGLHLSVCDILYKHIEDDDNGYKKSKISFSGTPYTAPFWPADRTDKLTPLSRLATCRKGVKRLCFEFVISEPKQHQNWVRPWCFLFGNSTVFYYF